MIAEFAVKEGGTFKSICSERNIRSWWDGDDYPCPEHFSNVIRMPRVKWHIRNKIHYTEPPWNSDFFHGLITVANIRWNTASLPRLYYYGKDRLTKLLLSSPFGGHFSEGALNSTKGVRRKWTKVGALYLDYNPKSIYFMAGVMASGEKPTYEKNHYIKYNIKQLSYFKEWGIPIEHEKVRHFMISPIWPALLSLYMPDGNKEYFMVTKAYNTHIYAPVLWKMYTNKPFITKAMPYLKSQRQIYTDHKCEEGVSRRIEMLRIELNLIYLDDRIKKAVRRWSKAV